MQSGEIMNCFPESGAVNVCLADEGDVVDAVKVNEQWLILEVKHYKEGSQVKVRGWSMTSSW